MGIPSCPPPEALHSEDRARTLREAYELVAHEALAELCERHSAQLGNAPASFLPIRDQADMPWRLRYQEMLEYQAEIAAHPARFGRDQEVQLDLLEMSRSARG